MLKQTRIILILAFACMLLLAPVFGAVVSRWPRQVVVPLFNLAGIACLLACPAGGGRAKSRRQRRTFYLTRHRIYSELRVK